MGFSVKGGSFTLNTSTGAQSITGVGFQPSCVLFWASKSSDGAEMLLSFGVGAASGQWVTAVNSADAQGTADAARYASNAKCIALPTASAGTKITVSLTSLNVDGFTVNVDSTDASTLRVHYLAFGGTWVNTKVGTITTNTGNGNQSITGVGFQPKGVIFASTSGTSVNPGAQTSSALSIGAATAALSQWGQGILSTDAASPSDTAKRQGTDAFNYAIGTTSAMGEIEAYVSHDSDGFTINKSSSDGNARVLYYLAIGGAVQLASGTITEPGSTGNSSVSSLSFRPYFVLFGGFNKPTTSGITAHAHLSIGIGVSSSDRRAVAISDTDNLGTTETASAVSESACILHASGNTPTRNTVADFVSNNSDGFTVSFSTVSGSSNEIPYFLVGEPAFLEKSFTSTGAITGAMAQIPTTPVSFTSTGAMTSSFVRSAVLNASASNTGAITGSMAAAKIGNAVFASTGVMSGTFTASAVLSATFASTAHIMNFFAQAGEELDVWAVTLDASPDGKRYPAYPFTNYNFNSFAKLGGLTYAAGDSGTFVLGDTDDNGTPIDAFLKTADRSMGTDRDKRCNIAYLVGTSDAEMLLAVEDGHGNTYEYEARSASRDEPGRQKVKLGRGLAGSHWSWTIKNQDGSDFDISDLMARIEAMQRRIK